MNRVHLHDNSESGRHENAPTCAMPTVQKEPLHRPFQSQSKVMSHALLFAEVSRSRWGSPRLPLRPDWMPALASIVVPSGQRREYALCLLSLRLDTGVDQWVLSYGLSCSLWMPKLCLNTTTDCCLLSRSSARLDSDEYFRSANAEFKIFQFATKAHCKPWPRFDLYWTQWWMNAIMTAMLIATTRLLLKAAGPQPTLLDGNGSTAMTSPCERSRRSARMLQSSSPTLFEENADTHLMRNRTKCLQQNIRCTRSILSVRLQPTLDTYHTIVGRSCFGRRQAGKALKVTR